MLRFPAVAVSPGARRAPATPVRALPVLLSGRTAVFAPKPRDYSYVLNKKVKRLALKSVLSAKAAEGKLVVIDSIKMDAIKTADFRKFLSAVKVDGKAVVVTPEVDNVIVKSARNIPGVLTTVANILSVYDIINAQYLVVDQAALAKIEEVYA